MPIVNFQGALSEKKRHAATTFVNRISRKVSLEGRANALAGPEGQVVVLYTTVEKPSRERTIRNVMSKVSQELLDSEGVWVVGVPEHRRTPKSSIEVTQVQLKKSRRK